MAPAGYYSCSGCGRLFKADDPAEMIVYDDHDCEWSDSLLDREIVRVAAKLV